MEGREVVIVEAVRTPVDAATPKRATTRTSTRTSCSAARGQGDRPRGHPRELVEDVIGLRAAVRRAVLQHRPKRLAAGGPPDRDPRDDDRSPVRIRAAGGQLRRVARRERRPRRCDRRRRRAHGSRAAVGERCDRRDARHAIPAAAPRAPSARQPGAERGADRGAVGCRGASATRSRSGRTSAPPLQPTKDASRARSCPSRSTAPLDVDQGIRRDTTLEALAELRPAFRRTAS